jgi:hypothetical protein
MLEPDMIFFDKLTHSQVPRPFAPWGSLLLLRTCASHRSLSSVRCVKKMRALESLTTNLERLGYADWANIPLLIGRLPPSALCVMGVSRG